MTLALFDFLDIVAALAPGEQLAQPAIGRAVARIDENIRRAVHEDEARADQELWLVFCLGILKFLVGSHHAGQRIVVGNADDGKTKIACLAHIGARIRSTAEKGKVRGDADLGIVRRCCLNVAPANSPYVAHANSPCTNQLAGTGSPFSSASSLP